MRARSFSSASFDREDGRLAIFVTRAGAPAGLVVELLVAGDIA